MGIPFFFRDIVAKNRDILTVVPSCDRLFLDFNSVIHMCSAQVMTEHTTFSNEAERNNMIFKKITEYTDMIVQSCPPTRLLHIAIDGVAPLAKMTQQRKRRHMTAHRNECIQEFKLKHDIPFGVWDSNAITPGTAFMYDLDSYLKNHYKSHTQPFEVVVSGPFEQGEGEHKIIHYIKNTIGRETENEIIEPCRYKDVIYGLDADLIMLALTCAKSNIFLMRESQQFGGKQTNLSDIPTFQYVNMDVMRRHVSMFLYQQEDEQYMLDYVFICFLLGNDFLPHPFVMSIRHGGVDQLCEAYREVHRSTQQFCVQRGDDGRFKVNMDVFAKLLQALACKEDVRMKEIVKTYFDTPFFDRPNKNILDKYMQDIDNMPMRNRKKLFDPEQDPLWRNSYYYHLLRINPYTERGQIDNVCEQFVRGLLWNVDYYFNGVFSHEWFYPYPFAPPLRDLSSFLQKCSLLDMNIQVPMPSASSFITPEEQLVLVLPVQSKQLLPTYVRKIYEDPSIGCMHFFPKKFRIETFLKHQLWECTPILPLLNVSYIKSKIAQLKKI